MTLEELDALGSETITAQQCAEVLNCAPQLIRDSGKAGTLPFPCICLGNRTIIPRRAFCAYMRGELMKEI